MNKYEHLIGQAVTVDPATLSGYTVEGELVQIVEIVPGSPLAFIRYRNAGARAGSKREFGSYSAKLTDCLINGSPITIA